MAETRRVEELLHLDTYQGMSDEEIELVIDFKIQMALLDDLHKEQIKDLQNQEVIANQILAEGQYAALSMVAQAINCDLNLEVVENV